jgi:hypothetical protein
MMEFPTPQFDHVKLKLNSGQIVAISRAIPLQLFYERAVYLLPKNQRSRQEIYGRTQKKCSFSMGGSTSMCPCSKKGGYKLSTTTATQGKLNRTDEFKHGFQLTGNTAPKVVFLSLNSRV